MYILLINFCFYLKLESSKKPKETDLFNGSPEAAYEPTYPQVNNIIPKVK